MSRWYSDSQIAAGVNARASSDNGLLSQIRLCIEPWHDLCRQSFAGDFSVQHRYTTPPSDHIPLGRVVPCHGRARPNCGDREPVKLFRRAKTVKPFHRADEAIFMVPRRHRETNGWYHTRGSTMGFDHVGHHHQPDLSPVVQEIPCRSAEADRTGSPVGLRSETNRTPRF